MNAEQVKDEIRNLNQIDKAEIYKWIDEEAASDLLSQIGVREKRTEVHMNRPKKRVHRLIA